MVDELLGYSADPFLQCGYFGSDFAAAVGLSTSKAAVTKVKLLARRFQGLVGGIPVDFLVGT